jgi:two-component system chemotaxis response regulator CheB
MAHHDIIVIGASAGGVEALLQLAAQLPYDLPAAVFVVQHTSPDGPGRLAALLNPAGPLEARPAQHGEAIQRGVIYVAPPDQHLLVHKDYIGISRGPRENRARPAIDPLFRSAAVAYGSRVIGVVLTGLLDDGTAGLLAVKRCGGVAVVQHPDDAMYSDMPASALANVEVDYCLPLASLGRLLTKLAHEEPAGREVEAPQDIVVEAQMAEHVKSVIPSEEELGTPALYGCPECGGPMWELRNDGLRRYRCHVGHAFTSRTLLGDQDEALEKALWIALRTLEERANMLASLAQDEREKGRYRSAKMYAERAAESRTHAQTLSALLVQGA